MGVDKMRYGNGNDPEPTEQELSEDEYLELFIEEQEHYEHDMMTQRELELEEKLVEQQRNQQIKALDLIASWNPTRQQEEIGVAISQWTSANDWGLWPIFEAALEDSNYHSLIPILKQAWDKWEKDMETKQAEFEAMMGDKWKQQLF